MARYKPDARAQDQKFALSLLDQLTPVTHEHAIDHLVDSKVGIEPFDHRYVKIAGASSEAFD